MGPAAGAMIELIKIVLHLLISGTSTAGVGDIANFAIGCAFILPAAWIYKAKHSRKSAMIGMAAGTVFMAFIGCFLNAYVLLPAYAKAFSMPIDALVGMGTAVNGHITNLLTFVVFAVAPFNLFERCNGIRCSTSDLQEDQSDSENEIISAGFCSNIII